VTIIAYAATALAALVVVRLELGRSPVSRPRLEPVAPEPPSATSLADARAYLAAHNLTPRWTTAPATDPASVAVVKAGPCVRLAAPQTAPVTPEDARATYYAGVKAGALSRYEYARLLAFDVEGAVN
jgi:hypothetical protein